MRRFISTWSIIRSVSPVYEKIEVPQLNKALDYAVCNAYHVSGKFFSGGWGEARLSPLLYNFVSSGKINNFEVPNINVKLNGSFTNVQGNSIYNGEFDVPDSLIYEYLPLNSKKGYFEFHYIPNIDPNCTIRPLAILLPGTGEVGYDSRRDLVSTPLAQYNISSLILEGPYYGLRKPDKRSTSALRYVSDLLTLGFETVIEASSLVKWGYNQGFFPIIVAGHSMGGLHSLMTTTLVKDIKLGCMSWLGPPSAIPVFTNGLLSTAVDWNTLKVDAIKKCLYYYLKDIDYISDINFEKYLHQLMCKFLAVTDISLFPEPVYPDYARMILAKSDLYIPSDNIYDHLTTYADRHKVRVDWIGSSHVSGYLFRRRHWNNDLYDLVKYILRKENYLSDF